MVLKERNSPYIEGGETSDWLKVKNWKSDEAVAIGLTKGKGANASSFGSIILAQKDKKGKWRYVGKTAGFKEKEKIRLFSKFAKLETSSSPAVDVPNGVQGQAIAWLKPEVVVEVKFLERTDSGVLRMPDFLRERTDKTPSECKIK